jgi:2-keto-myo-inositol isomerase
MGMANIRYCLNTSTIRGQQLSLVEEVQLTAGTGYQAIEPWIAEVEEFVQQGGCLADLRRRIDDLGLTLEGSVGFSQWISDAGQSPAGWEAWKHDLDLMAQLGAKRIAAPPTRAVHEAEEDLLKVANRYWRLIEMGSQFGIVPQVELWGRTRWGPSHTLARLGEVAFVVVEAGHPDACALLDVFHFYTGGSPFEGVRHFAEASSPVFHLNDYPAEPPRTDIISAGRVFPGDGVAPLDAMLRDLKAVGFNGAFSLELVNRDYWRQDAMEIARTGLEKMRTVVARVMQAANY